MSKNKNILWYILAVAIVAADFAVKRHILAAYSVGERFGGIPAVCDFVYVKNTGAAFSMLSGKTWFFLLVTAVFFALVFIAVRKKWFSGTLFRIL